MKKPFRLLLCLTLAILLREGLANTNQVPSAGDAPGAPPVLADAPLLSYGPPPPAALEPEGAAAPLEEVNGALGATNSIACSTNSVGCATNLPAGHASLPPGGTNNCPPPPVVPVDLAAEPAEADSAESNEAEEIIPVVVFDEAPLMDVIKTLARQARINFQFDPRLASAVGPDGKPIVPPPVSLRLENVTARQVLDAVLKNYDYALIPDPKTGISRITLKDPAAPEPLITRVIQLQYSNPTNMVTVIRSAFMSTVPGQPSRSQVIPDMRTSQLVVIATEAEMMAVDALLQKLDTPTKQILIEARLLETSQSPQSIKGIDWSGTLEAQRFSFGNGNTIASSTTLRPGTPVTTTLPSGRTVTTTPSSSTFSTATTTVGASGNSGSSGSSGQAAASPASLPGGLSANTLNGFHPGVAFLNADGVSAVLSFLNKDSDTEVVATPRAVTLDNEPATLSVTRAFPIFKITPGSANSPAGAEITYTNLGTILNVTPRISGSNNIALRVVPEVSNIDSKDQQTINGQVNVANIYAIRRIETHVMIPSGHTLVMGGLISDSLNKSYNKVPILGDLPGIGLAFRRDAKLRIKQNLLIFITPSIIKDTDFQAPTASSFLQSQPKDSTDANFSAWDSGKPYDWGRKKSGASQSSR